MIFYKQCFAQYAIIDGEVADSATVPALLELDPRSFRKNERICDFYCFVLEEFVIFIVIVFIIILFMEEFVIFYCCCVCYYTVYYIPLIQIKKLKFCLNQYHQNDVGFPWIVLNSSDTNQKNS